MKLLRLMILLAGLSCLLPAQAEERPARVTVIFDAFGKPSDLERGWGYSALVEYGGKRILFDAGGQYQAFADNVRKLKIDLRRSISSSSRTGMAITRAVSPTCWNRIRT